MKLGLGLGLTSLRSAGLSSLFPSGQPGHWPDGYNPALGRLFQDAAGTIPVTAPDQPVGLVKRSAGTADASQGTALSRPTLGRWPRGGRRNLLRWTEDFSNGAWLAYISKPTFSVGHTAPDGADTASGWDLSAIGSGIFQGMYQPKSGLTGSHTTSLWMRSSTPISDIKFGFEDGHIASISVTTEWQRFDMTRNHPLSQNRGMTLYCYGPRTATLYIWGAQMEADSVATPYQRVTTDFDVTEAGVPDVWHLYNDGGDSLPVTLPAGTYGRARVNTEGVVTVDTVVDPTGALSGTRQVDVILRQGAFSAAEEAQIRAYWARYAA